MELFGIAFFVCIPMGYVVESYYYSFQKIGKFTSATWTTIGLYNLVGIVLIACIKYMWDVQGRENFSTIDEYAFFIANAIVLSIWGANGASIGGWIRAQRRYLNGEQVPAHLMRSEEDEERDAKIREARKEEEYKMREEEVGLVAEPDPEYKKDEAGHEAELEAILKSKKQS